MNWYVLFVETGEEEKIQKWLNYYFSEDVLHSLIPKRKLTEKKQGQIFHVEKKLFPGYIFIYTDMNINKYLTIKSIPRYIKVLNMENSSFLQVDEKEISVILKLIGGSGIINYSQVYIENHKVVVHSGPLKGIEGIIKKFDKHNRRAKILLNFMGTARTVDVGIEIIKEID